MLSAFPPEVVLNILGFLPAYSLPALECASSAWKHFFDIHQSIIYQSAATFHGIASPGSPIEDVARAHISPWLDNVTNWKDLCRKYIVLEKSWAGKGVTEITFGLDMAAWISAFKLDEEQRTIICTTRDEGWLKVICAKTGDLLWDHPAGLDAPVSAQFDYSHGFIAFPRNAMQVEIWQRSTDYATSSFTPAPDADQTTAWQPYAHIPAARGHYRPFTVLSSLSPNLIDAFRFVFPYLLGISEMDYFVSIWDVTTAALVQTLTLTTPEHDFHDPRFGPRIRSLDMTQEHILVCSITRLGIYCRKTGEAVFQSSIPPSNIDSLFPHVTSSMECVLGRPLAWLKMPGSIVTSYDIRPRDPNDQSSSMQNGFRAAHLSPCGNNLVVISSHGRVYYIPSFSNSSDMRSRIRIVDMEGDTTVTAFDGKRVALYSGSELYCISLNDSPTAVLPPRSQPICHSFGFPSTSIQHIASFSSPTEYNHNIYVTSVQLTSTSLWVHSFIHSPGRRVPRLHCVDFSRHI
ncbi:hypothetical protein BOTBODRAFT_361508 [Botryobasidium botryosum FD-172 SS1]|uniref:F-box domain-containing protein n=1 Tax=Botryobasidium botryosum (strain FD-172 SS1) TaxID=930990 RepID=A0A067ME80_BOTB1|nr:hypothetical protein BOTBODRAFT_361508 [Botryobasidium botryosum FD-172 SS1]